MISFTIPGTPVPQGRPRVTRTGHAYYDSKTKEYRETVRQCAIVAQNGRDSLTGALAMIVDCTFPVPESWPKYKRHEALAGAWHTSTKDIDNCIKAIADSLNGIIYEDDSQIALLVGSKKYGSAPQAKVTIYELDCVENPLWLIANIKRAVEAGTL